MRLVQYLQARNPSVPAIPLKIRAPLDAYLRPLCEQQFDALLTVRGRGGRHRSVYESYLAVDPMALSYERTTGALDSFTDAVSRAITPLHQIARNQGFPLWHPSVEYAAVGL